MKLKSLFIQAFYRLYYTMVCPKNRFYECVSIGTLSSFADLLTLFFPLEFVTDCSELLWTGEITETVSY